MKYSLSIALIAIACSMVLAGCDSGSSSKGAAAGPNLNVNLEQFDADEKATAAITIEEQNAAVATLQDMARVNYLGSEAQEQEKATTSTSSSSSSSSSSSNSFFDNEALAQDLKRQMNNSTACNPNLLENQTSQAGSRVRFEVIGSQCPLTLHTSISSQNTGTKNRMVMNASGQFDFTVNENASLGMRQQDLTSGKMNLAAQVVIDMNEASKTFSMSANLNTQGELVTKKYGRAEISQRQIVASQMMMDSSRQENKTVMRGVTQLKLKTASKNLVLTIKIDSTAGQPVRCSMNQKAIDLTTCEKIAKQLNLSSSSSSSSSSSPVRR